MFFIFAVAVTPFRQLSVYAQSIKSTSNITIGGRQPVKLRPQPVNLTPQPVKFEPTCKFMTNQLIFIGIDVIKKGFFQ